MNLLGNVTDLRGIEAVSTPGVDGERQISGTKGPRRVLGVSVWG